MRNKYAKMVIKSFTLFLIIFTLGGCMEEQRKDSENNKRFPAEEYFSGKRLEMGKAIYQNDKNKVRELLQKGIDINENDEQGNGFTYLMYSVFLDNRFEIAKILLQHKANPNLVSKVYFPEFKMVDEYLPLTFASERLPIEYMKLLLEHGADPNYAYVDEKGQIPLNARQAIHGAVGSSYILWKWEREDYMNDIKARVDLLLNYGADINSIGSMNESVVESAEPNPEIVVYLMNKGADHRLYGKKVLRVYKEILRVGPEVKPYQEEVIRRLTELGY